MKIKKEDLTVLVIMIVVIIALIYFIPKFTGDVVTVTKTYTCTDSDGGKTYSIKGTLNAGPTIDGTDYCIDSVKLREYYCTDNGLDLEYYDCPNGCQNGACIGTVAEMTGTLSAEKPFVRANNTWFWVVVVVGLIILFLILKKLKK